MVYGEIKLYVCEEKRVTGSPSVLCSLCLAALGNLSCGLHQVSCVLTIVSFSPLQRKERQEQHAYKLEQDLALCKFLSTMVTEYWNYLKYPGDQVLS